MPSRTFIIAIFGAMAALSGLGSVALISVFDLAGAIGDRFAELSALYWVFVAAIFLCAIIVALSLTFHRRKAIWFEQVGGATLMFTLAAAGRPFIIAFVGLPAPASFSARAPWLALGLLTVMLGCIVQVAALWSALVVSQSADAS